MTFSPTDTFQYKFLSIRIILHLDKNDKQQQRFGETVSIHNAVSAFRAACVQEIIRFTGFAVSSSRFR